MQILKVITCILDHELNTISVLPHSFAPCCTMEWWMLFALCSNQLGHIVSRSVWSGLTVLALYWARVRLSYMFPLQYLLSRPAQFLLDLLWLLRQFTYEWHSSVCESKVWSETFSSLRSAQLVPPPALCCSWPLTSRWRETGFTWMM